MENKLMNEEEFIKAVKKGVEQRIREYADGDEMYCNFEVMDGSSGVIDTDDVVKNTNGWIDCYFDFDYEVEDSRDEKTGVIDFDKMLEDVIDGYCSNMGQSGAVIDYTSIDDYDDSVDDCDEDDEDDDEDEE